MIKSKLQKDVNKKNKGLFLKLINNFITDY